MASTKHARTWAQSGMLQARRRSAGMGPNSRKGEQAGRVQAEKWYTSPIRREPNGKPKDAPIPPPQASVSS
eukprot:632876-Pyramimonas_sp.AAC.1